MNTKCYEVYIQFDCSGIRLVTMGSILALNTKASRVILGESPLQKDCQENCRDLSSFQLRLESNNFESELKNVVVERKKSGSSVYGPPYMVMSHVESTHLLPFLFSSREMVNE